MTTINWNNASQNAQAKFDTKVQNAAEDIVLGIDDLVADSSVPRTAKVQVLEQLAQTLGDRGRLQAFLSGQAQPAQTAVGSSNPAPQPSSAGTTAEQARIKKLEDGYRNLANELGISVPLTSGGGVDTDAFKGEAKRTVDDKVNKAKASSASSADTVEKSKVKTEAAKAKAALDKAKTKTTIIGGKQQHTLNEAEFLEVQKAVEDILKLV
jgi:hypothetical protein